jgi:GNAT acetyltransferase-like protein
VTVRIHVEHGRHPAAAARYFDLARLDAFHGPEMLTALHGDAWRGIVVEDGRHAWLHAIAPRAIRDTGYADVEPLLGYAGPVATTTEPGFLTAAWAAYAAYCRDARIVAELFRFHPLLRNHETAPADAVRLLGGKPIVCVPCHADPAAQLAAFPSDTARRAVRSAGRRLRFARLDDAGAVEEFRRFHHRSLDRVHAAAHWYMSAGFYAAAARSASCAVFVVRRGEEIVSAVLAVLHPFASYYLLAGNGAERVPGANELLVHGLAQACAQAGSPTLVLGGGNTAAADDSLLRFKRKFAASCDAFHVGGAVYLPRAYEDFCDAAVSAAPALATRPQFLTYRALAA